MTETKLTMVEGAGFGVTTTLMPSSGEPFGKVMLDPITERLYVAHVCEAMHGAMKVHGFVTDKKTTHADKEAAVEYLKKVWQEYKQHLTNL